MSDADDTILLAEMRVEFDFQGRRLSAPAKFVQRLQNDPHVVAQISEFPWSDKLFSHNSSQVASGDPLITPIPLEGPSQIHLDNGSVIDVVPISLFPGQQEFEVHLTQSPCVILDSKDAVREIRFDIMNFTRDLLNWPVTFSTRCWELSFVPVENRSKLVEKLRENAGFGITHRARLTRKDRRNFKVDEVQSFLDGVDTFLSFLCGSHCAITNAAGIEANGNIAWQRWGPRHVSGWKRQRSCMDITMTDRISEILTGFMERYFEDCDYMGRIIALYVTSNEMQSADISIMLSQIALESLTTIFNHDAGYKDEKIGNSIAQMLQNHNIDSNVPESFGALQNLAKSHNLQHGPHALVAVRNSFVHRENRLGSVSIDAYYEAKQLGLWYLELLLLHSFGYKGEYASRLKPVQRAGDTELVPWARSQGVDH